MTQTQKTQDKKVKAAGFVLPSHDEMVANIIDAYKRATPEQAVAGATWYSAAHELADAIHADVNAGAAIIAVLSPVLSWEKNVAMAVRAARAGTRKPAGVLGRSWAKAKAARVAGADLDSIVKGKKVRAFWVCIASNGTDPFAVCVDRHAVALACGRFLANDESGKAVNGKRYDLVADAYRDAAHVLGLTPCILQAVTWVVWRDTPWRQRPAA